MAVLGVALLATMWVQGARPAAAETAPAPQCVPGSGPPCQQAFFQIDKATGKVTGAVALPGENREGGDYDAVECHGAGEAKCFIAANGRGMQILSFSSFACDPTATTTALEVTGADFGVNGLAFDSASGTLYALKGAQLYVVDQRTGFMTQTSDWLGAATGDAGDREFDHVSALTFDPASGDIFGVENRGGNSSLLFRIDPATGKVVQDAFGTGKDYVQIAPVGGRNEVRGIVVADGKLFATMSLWDFDPHLAIIDPATGETTDVGAQGVPSVGSLTADGSGQLYGTAATGGAVVDLKPCPAPPEQPAPPVKVETATPPAAVEPPPAEVLGVQVRKDAPAKPTSLPVTGSSTTPLVALAVMCFLLGAAALRLSSRRRGLPGEP